MEIRLKEKIISLGTIALHSKKAVNFYWIWIKIIHSKIYHKKGSNNSWSRSLCGLKESSKQKWKIIWK